MESEEVRKKAFSNKNQLEKLVILMEQNPSIAKGIMKKNEADLKWGMFAEDLNSLGPPIKTAGKWAKVWIDLKSKLKKKLINNKKEIDSTGGGPCNLQILNSLEKRVSEFLSLECCVNPPGRKFGINAEEIAESENIFENDIELVENNVPIMNTNEAEKPPSSSNINKTTKAKRIHIADKRVKMLENHNDEFKALRNDISEIKGYIDNMLEYTKKTYYLQKDTNKELLKLKKEKLKIYEEEIKKKQKDKAIKLKLKMELLELQKKGFEG